jgi:hypothetical protein
MVGTNYIMMADRDAGRWRVRLEIQELPRHADGQMALAQFDADSAMIDNFL